MGRKKGSTVVKEDVRPFCFYCDRKFENEQVLLQHQRAKHFRCQECDDGAIRGKCESVQGLIVHTLKVHGKALARVPNAMQGRDNPELNVYGMEGIPIEMLRQKGYASELMAAPAMRATVEPPHAPFSEAPHAFSPQALLGLPGLTPQAQLSLLPHAGSFGSMPAPEFQPSMLGQPGLPAPPGMPGLQQMLGMPGLPAPPGMAAAGLTPPDPKSVLPHGAPRLSTVLPLPVAHGVLPLPVAHGTPGLGVQPLPVAHVAPSASAELAAEGPLAALQKAVAEAQSRIVSSMGPEAGRGVKRSLEPEVASKFEDDDMSVEELRAKLDRYKLGA